ncbi:MAG: LysM peptidoglycan-binding domain-containing protein, partial [Chloroflexota bacterium]
MSQPYKICPICESPNHRNAIICSTCGATLTQVPSVTPDDNPSNRGATPGYDQHYGETDLFESNLHWRGGTYLVGGLVTLAILACTATLLVLGTRLFNNTAPPSNPAFQGGGTLTAIPTLGNGLDITTNTAHPTIFLATVTQGPPTETPTASPTITPTQGPCTQTVLPGDDLISIIYRCGHRNFESIVDTVVELNKLKDASHIQEGQTIEVPWPTPTLDPNALPTETPTPAEGSALTDGSISVADSGASIMGVRLIPTETLQPGVTWHTVVKDENIIIIAVEYGATLRILSELNPEITFSQCDFGLGTGGSNCVVQLFEGQQVRVPAPTPTPTIQPSPNGSETPTPTVTATFNAPTALSPSNRAFFGKDDLVTLRWVASG